MPSGNKDSIRFRRQLELGNIVRAPELQHNTIKLGDEGPFPTSSLFLQRKTLYSIRKFSSLLTNIPFILFYFSVKMFTVINHLNNKRD